MRPLKRLISISLTTGASQTDGPRNQVNAPIRGPLARVLRHAVRGEDPTETGVGNGYEEFRCRYTLQWVMQPTVDIVTRDGHSEARTRRMRDFCKKASTEVKRTSE
jgi:hypothetical protein